MKSKAPLALMEQMVMLLVFALAAALCLQAFVQSDRISRESEARDHAAVLCQSVAETIRHNGGVAETREGTGHGGLDELGNVCVLPTSGEMMLFYDPDWGRLEAPPVSENTAWVLPTETGYYLTIEEQPSDLPNLGRATVQVKAVDWNEPIGEEETLFDLTVSWQMPLIPISQEDRDRARQEAERLLKEMSEGGENVLLEGNLSGETDGLGGWCRYFNKDWELEFAYGVGTFEVWYRPEGKVTVYWRETDEYGFITGVSVPICIVDSEEVTVHG